MEEDYTSFQPQTCFSVSMLTFGNMAQYPVFAIPSPALQGALASAVLEGPVAGSLRRNQESRVLQSPWLKSRYVVPCRGTCQAEGQFRLSKRSVGPRGSVGAKRMTATEPLKAVGSFGAFPQLRSLQAACTVHPTSPCSQGGIAEQYKWSKLRTNPSQVFDFKSVLAFSCSQGVSQVIGMRRCRLPAPFASSLSPTHAVVAWYRDRVICWVPITLGVQNGESPV